LLSPITLSEDDQSSVSTNVLSNDTGLGDAPITVQVTTQPGKGTTTVNPDKTITYKPNANANGSDTYGYTVTDSDGQTSTATVYLQITPVNDAPTVSDIPNQTISEDTDTGNISFTVGDVETLAALLTVSGSSSNTTLVPNENITFSGLGANRTVRVTPVADRSGTAEITVKIGDGNTEATEVFTLTVSDLTAPETILDTEPPTFANSNSASFAFSSEVGALFKCSLDGSAWSSCTSPQNYSGLAEGEHTFQVRAIDAEGNVDPTPVGHAWTVDTVAPGETVSINNGATYTNSRTVALALGASDPVPGSGIASMCFSDDAATWSSWESYAASKSWMLDPDNGTKTVLVRSRIVPATRRPCSPP
jgi:hypothetical protein